MKKLLTAIAGMAIALQAVTAAAEPPAPPTPPMPRTITVTGESREDVSPDQAVLSMSLVSKDKELGDAKQKNDRLLDKVIGVTRQYAIAKEKIATSGIYISPDYTYNTTTNQQMFSGYTVNRSLRITIDDLAIQEKLLADMVKVNVEQVNGLEFQLADPEKAAMPLRVKAFENARAKAEALAAAAGGKLGKALTIVAGEAPAGNVPRPPMPMFAKAMSAAGASGPAPVLPGLITLEDTVTVTFALE